VRSLLHLKRWLGCSLLLCCCFGALGANTDHAARIASLIAPAKLATLSERGANPRVQKAVYWLATARKEGQKPDAVLERAVSLAGYTIRQDWRDWRRQKQVDPHSGKRSPDLILRIEILFLVQDRAEMLVSHAMSSPISLNLHMETFCG
jgi:hypothetical protein